MKTMKFILFLTTKILQAAGIGFSIMALFAGVKGSMKWEMMLFTIGLGIFIFGRWLEKQIPPGRL